MAAGWIGIDSSHLDSYCGYTGGSYTLEDALDGLTRWLHYVNHKHWWILDLGVPYNISQVRGRSAAIFDPTDVDIYISNDTGNWGTAVALGISSWQDIATWVIELVTPTIGRYIKVEINATEDASRSLIFGWDFPIFDVYADVDYDNLVIPSALVLELDLQTPSIFFDLVTPVPVSALELDLQTPIILADEVLVPSALALKLKLRNHAIGCLFPTLQTSPKIESFIDEYSDETVLQEFYESGRPFVNLQFTSDPKNFGYVLRYVSNSDKNIVMQFYQNNKSGLVFWLNEQDSVVYTVIFIHKPYCELDSHKDEWKMRIGFKQIV